MLSDSQFRCGGMGFTSLGHRGGGAAEGDIGAFGGESREVAEIFRRALTLSEAAPLSRDDLARMRIRPGSMARVFDGVRHLADNIHRVPAFVIPAVEGRTDAASVQVQSGTWGSILPAVWAFMLAARARGLGTVWTTAQAPLERELSAILDVPYDEVMLAAFLPLAFTLGTEFKPAARVPRDRVLHWQRW
ncbi:nitroreductase family protein [Nocardia sp. NPDC059246]|uniref:nitroreductase family protein n=1 Tax=unclassified Nocardia TaxID=2637762 RepID=UPI00368E27C5